MTATTLRRRFDSLYGVTAAAANPDGEYYTLHRSGGTLYAARYSGAAWLLDRASALNGSAAAVAGASLILTDSEGLVGDGAIVYPPDLTSLDSWDVAIDTHYTYNVPAGWEHYGGAVYAGGWLWWVEHEVPEIDFALSVRLRKARADLTGVVTVSTLAFEPNTAIVGSTATPSFGAIYACANELRFQGYVNGWEANNDSGWMILEMRLPYNGGAIEWLASTQLDVGNVSWQRTTGDGFESGAGALVIAEDFNTPLDPAVYLFPAATLIDWSGGSWPDSGSPPYDPMAPYIDAGWSAVPVTHTSTLAGGTLSAYDAATGRLLRGAQPGATTPLELTMANHPSTSSPPDLVWMKE